MDVVAQARSVRCVVVVTEHLEAVPPESGVDGPRNKVTFRSMILAEFTVRIGTRRIEVPQRDRLESVSAIVVRQGSLDGEFRLAVRVDWVSGMSFGDGSLDWITEDRGGR